MHYEYEFTIHYYKVAPGFQKILRKKKKVPRIKKGWEPMIQGYRPEKN